MAANDFPARHSAHSASENVATNHAAQHSLSAGHRGHGFGLSRRFLILRIMAWTKAVNCVVHRWWWEASAEFFGDLSGNLRSDFNAQSESEMHLRSVRCPASGRGDFKEISRKEAGSLQPTLQIDRSCNSISARSKMLPLSTEPGSIAGSWTFV
jgi:hypothetical protein